MIKWHNLLVSVLFYIITLGLYGFYWFYVSSKEMVEYKKLEGSPGLWTVLLFIPCGALYSYWKHSAAVDALTNGKIQQGDYVSPLDIL